MTAALQCSFALEHGRRLNFSAETFEVGQNPLDNEVLTPVQIVALHKIMAQAQLMAMNLSAESLAALGSLMQSINVLAAGLSRYTGGVHLTTEQKETQSQEMRAMATDVRDHIKSAQTATSGNPQLQAALASSLSLLNTIVPTQTKTGQVIRLAVVRCGKTIQPVRDVKMGMKSEGAKAAVTKTGAKNTGAGLAKAPVSDAKNVKTAPTTQALQGKMPAAQTTPLPKASATILEFSKARTATATIAAPRNGLPSISQSAAVIQLARGIAPPTTSSTVNATSGAKGATHTVIAAGENSVKSVVGTPVAAKVDAPQSGVAPQSAKGVSSSLPETVRSTENSVPRATQAVSNVAGHITGVANVTPSNVNPSPMAAEGNLQQITGTPIAAKSDGTQSLPASSVSAQSTTPVPAINQVGISSVLPMLSLQVIQGADQLLQPRQTDTTPVVGIQLQALQQPERVSDPLLRVGAPDFKTTSMGAGQVEQSSVDVPQRAISEKIVNTALGTSSAVEAPTLPANPLPVIVEQTSKAIEPFVAKSETILPSLDQRLQKQTGVPQSLSSTESGIVASVVGSERGVVKDIIKQFKKANATTCPPGCNGALGCCRPITANIQSVQNRFAQLKG